MPPSSSARARAKKMDGLVEDEDEESLIVQWRDLRVPGLALLLVSLSLDSCYSRLGIPFWRGLLLPHFWIMNLALVTFLLGIGVAWYYAQEYIRKEVLTYFVRRRNMNWSLKNLIDVAIGFCVPIVIFPFWLSVREGTIECFVNHDCRNVFGVLYLGITDVFVLWIWLKRTHPEPEPFIIESCFIAVRNIFKVDICDTSPRAITGTRIPACEGFLYPLPVLAFTLVPVVLAFIMHNKHISSAATESDGSDPSTPAQTPSQAGPQVQPILVPTAGTARSRRPTHIRLSLTPQHPPLVSSSTVLGD